MTTQEIERVIDEQKTKREQALGQANFITGYIAALTEIKAILTEEATAPTSEAETDVYEQAAAAVSNIQKKSKLKAVATPVE